MERNCRDLGLKLQEARKKIEDKEMMSEGLGAIISEKTKDTEALEKKKKNYIGDLENTSRLRSQLGVASCGDGSRAGRGFFISKWMMKMFHISSFDSLLACGAASCISKNKCREALVKRSIFRSYSLKLLNGPRGFHDFGHRRLEIKNGLY